MIDDVLYVFTQNQDLIIVANPLIDFSIGCIYLTLYFYIHKPCGPS